MAKVSLNIYHFKRLKDQGDRSVVEPWLTMCQPLAQEKRPSVGAEMYHMHMHVCTCMLLYAPNTIK